MNGARSWGMAAAAGLLMLAAVAYSARTLAVTPERLALVQRRHADWLHLRAQAAELAAHRAALAERTADGPAVPLGEWLRERRPGWTVDLREAGVERINRDWSLQRMNVTVADVNLADAGDTMAALAALQPPWRVMEVSLAAGDTPGRGRVSWVLEGLVRTPAASP